MTSVELGTEYQEVRTGDRRRGPQPNMVAVASSVVVESPEDKTLDIQDDVGDILDHAFGDGHELVLHAIDLNGRRRRHPSSEDSRTRRMELPSVSP